LPLAEVYGPAVILTNHREVPLSERRIVLYTCSAPDVGPADPCNKMPGRRDQSGRIFLKNDRLVFHEGE